MSIVLVGSTSGSITLQEPAVAGTTVLTLPTTSGTVMINGPAFSAYPSSATSISTSTWFKLTCNTEEFDTNSNYDATTNYRFTPTVAGYYQVNVAFSCSANCPIIASIYKNGSEFKRGNQAGATNFAQVTCSALVYLNGTTDYIEGYGYQSSGSTQTLSNSAIQCYFQATMTRGA